MAKYEALCSFVGLDLSAAKGQVIELNGAMAKDLLRAGYVKAVAAEEPAPELEPKEAPVKKAPAKKKATTKKKTTAKKG